MADISKEKALEYHKHGKIGIDLTKPCSSQHELSLAYTPGVAIPCLEIAKDEDLSFEYTNRANLVAVVSDGTAVLGLGNIGPLASKPVMEGKSVLFKKFADVDAFDIELDVHSIEEIVATCKAIAPTFGGINLEDIKAPQCFEIERILKEELDIPVFHDDQHGTAIITTAGLMNVLELTGKKVNEIKS
jgi:malate dehydrogenase (oxaloacetate-decarboxylating)(NADP+)